MPASRLSPLDQSFLAVETPTAHMHVGWMATFAPPTEGERPTFEELRDHIAHRLARAPRYRQRIQPFPFDLMEPAWVDDKGFALDNHVLRAGSNRFSEIVDEALSQPLPHDRPLWQLYIADRLEDGRIGVVGKAHHCMVDGIAAVELASLLLDPESGAADPEPDHWQPRPPPSRASLLAEALAERTQWGLRVAAAPARLLRSPPAAVGLVARVGEATAALLDAIRPAHPVEALNEPISPLRHLATTVRPLEELRFVANAFRATINDVLLAIAAGAIRRYLIDRAESPIRLKTMVPVNVRDPASKETLGNQISFLFVDLPCDEPDPVRRVRDVQREMALRKQAHEAEGALTILGLAAQVPRRLRASFSRLIASPRTFNLVVSNIPGPSKPLYMLGCRLEEAYPVVPLADRHALSVGMTTVCDRACFGLYADRTRLPDVDELAGDIDTEFEQLLALCPRAAVREPQLVAAG